MTIKKENVPYISFAELAACNVPNQIPAEESEKLVTFWIKVACLLVESETGVKPKEDDILFQLADSEWIFSCQNPDDDEDEADFVDLHCIGELLDDIVEDTIRDIKEEQEEERAEHRFFKDAEGCLYTCDTLRYEYASFMETIPENDIAYKDMSFEDWIDEWFLSGFDCSEITEEEYKMLSKKI